MTEYFGTSDRACRIDGDHLANDEPIEQHTDCGQVLFNRGCCQTHLQRLYIGRYMYGLDIGKLTKIFVFTPQGKLNGSPRIGSAGVGIPYIGGEELNEAPASIFIPCEQLRQHGRPGNHPDNVLGHACSLSPVSA